MMQGKLYLLPIPISAGNMDSLSNEIKKVIPLLKYFFVENIRTARRFIKNIYPEANIDGIEFSEIDKHAGADISLLKNWLESGKDVGIMSESGCPGIADPGADLIAVAHEMNIEIIPLVGPSSILLALMASGFNGQRFCFNGYLPVKEPSRSKEIKNYELLSQTQHLTQIFIETPYRNNNLVDDLLKNCKDNTRLCIAYNITAADQFIKTKTIKQWKQHKPALDKQPCVFLIMA